MENKEQIPIQLSDINIADLIHTAIQRGDIELSDSFRISRLKTDEERIQMLNNIIKWKKEKN